MQCFPGRGKNLVLLLLSLALILCAVIGGTLAWLVTETNPVVNTFTYGDINITLHETDTNKDGDNDPNTNIYYYRKPLKATESTTFLFERFTRPIPHSEGLKLDFVVLVQAVEAESDKTSVKDAWGETIANVLESLVVNAE